MLPTIIGGLFAAREKGKIDAYPARFSYWQEMAFGDER
jgi:hypothetical protein